MIVIQSIISQVGVFRFVLLPAFFAGIPGLASLPDHGDRPRNSAKLLVDTYH
jgi:hypothetical protein